jgi:hypothetical protein
MRLGVAALSSRVDGGLNEFTVLRTYASGQHTLTISTCTLRFAYFQEFEAAISCKAYMKEDNYICIFILCKRHTYPHIPKLNGLEQTGTPRQKTQQEESLPLFQPHSQ